MQRTLKILPRDLVAMKIKQAELLAKVRSRFPAYSDAPEAVLVELLGGEDDKFYRTLSDIISRKGS